MSKAQRAGPSQSQAYRANLTLLVMVAAAAALLWRGLDLTQNSREFLQGQGEARYIREVVIPAHRGMILDRNGHPLAISTPLESIWANPGELGANREQWDQLAELLDLDADRLHRDLAAHGDLEFRYIKRQVPPALAERVMALRIPGVGRIREYGRYYPAGEVTAHIVGFTDIDDVGREGLELAYESWLRGTPGSKRVLRDRLGQVIEDVESIRQPEPGQDLYLSIDHRVQYLAYRELKAAVKKHRARSGSIVLLDVDTGTVLAMANQPAYNPNNRADRVSERFRNRAVTDVFEPGSTVKPFTVAAGLLSGRFTPDSVFDTSPGHFRVANHTVNDARDYGAIDLRTVLKKSSNIGASKLALALPREDLWHTFHAVGFGQPSGSAFPGEADGILTDFRRWGEVHRATLAYGYGLSVSPLQLARAYAVIASGGLLRPVSFQRADQPVPGQRVLPEAVANQLVSMLENVLSDGGTATRARVAGFRVAGKTGTAHKSTRGGYAENRYVAVFAGLAPASRPRVAMVVVLNEPGSEEYFGGQVAAPVFANVMAGTLRILGVAPDDFDHVRQHIVMSGALAPTPWSEM